jgi:hypothetical protein
VINAQGDPDMVNIIRMGLAVVCGLAWVGVAAAAPIPEKKKLTEEERAKVEKAVKDYLQQMMAASGALQPLQDERLERVFPRHAFYTLLFRQYPVGRPAPKGFAVSNVLVADADGKVQVFTTASKDLLAFFNAAMRPSQTDDQVKDIGRAWIRVLQEFYQDGFYKFALMDDATKVTTDGATRKVSVKVVAMQGGNGEINATVEVAANGMLTKFDGTSSLKPGPRPICHATKLLDPDPLVRRIVEQDLLIMGVAAKPYLEEQRAKAAPELQQAIDRIWQRILDADR